MHLGHAGKNLAYKDYLLKVHVVGLSADRVATGWYL